VGFSFIHSRYYNSLEATTGEQLKPDEGGKKGVANAKSELFEVSLQSLIMLFIHEPHFMLGCGV
jgi:hypothetical protein